MRRQLAERYGTPQFVYTLDRIEDAVSALRAALPEPATLLYSVKANPHPDVVRLLRQLGCPAEVSSPGELAVALSAGFPGDECLYTGPGKRVDEMADALRRGVRRFSLESMGDLDRLATAATLTGRDAKVLLRVNSATAAGRAGMRMSGTASQFGIPEAEVAKVWGAAREHPLVEPYGLHLFPVSNAATEEALAAELVNSVETAARLSRDAGIPIRWLDLGGGFAAPYARAGRRFRYDTLRARLTSALDTHFPGHREGAPRLAFESGRYLVADCGELICRVVDLKESHRGWYAVLDAGVNHLGGMHALGRITPRATLPDPVEEQPGHPPRPVTLVGPLCTPADVHARAVELSGLSPGALLSIPNVGAYGLTASLIGFLSHPCPVETVLHRHRVISASRLTLVRSDVDESGGRDARA